MILVSRGSPENTEHVLDAFILKNWAEIFAPSVEKTSVDGGAFSR